MSRKQFGVGLCVAGVGCLIFAVIMVSAWAWDLPGLLGIYADGWRGIDSGPVIALGLVVVVLGLLVIGNPFAALSVAARQDLVPPESSTFGSIHFHEKMNSSTVNIAYPDNFNPAQMVLAQQLDRASSGLRRQEEILRSIYNQGLRQAQLSFMASMCFAVSGGALLLLGVGLAVTRAPTNGQQYASIVTALTGTVVTLTSALFFAQANSTRKTMGEQAVLLREESQDDRRINTSRELIVSVTDEELRNTLQADVSLALIGLFSFDWGAAGSDGGRSGGELVPVAAAGVE